MATFLKGERQTLGNVLLTGATGYLGIHVLHELINSDAKTIYCMVRGKDQQTAESRLKTLLFYYFSDSFKQLFGQRLFVVQADVTSFEDLPGIHIDTIFNCAANVKHFSKGTDIEDVNIGGAMSCVKYCLKTGARLVHVSTTSVGGLSVNGVPAPDVVLTERNLYFGQNLDNQYCYSKFMADRIILDAVALHGLNAKVMRVGNLAARSTDGEFQVNFQSNSYMGRIKVLNMLGCCTYAMYDEPAEFSPINETARAVVVLASTPKECTVFHPYNNHVQLMGDILTQLGNITGGVRFVDNDEFEDVLNQAKEDPVKAKQMASMLAYQDMAHGQVAVEVGRDNHYTSQVLHHLGFYWSPTSWDYDQQMLQAIAGFGFFE
jgi:thioester reductase-like protein